MVGSYPSSGSEFMPLPFRPRHTEFRNREGNSEFSFVLPRRNRAQGTSAFVRAKDEASKIEYCLRSILPVFDEIHVIDNGSRDDTAEIVRHLQRSGDAGEKICLHSYPFRVGRFGPEHDGTPADSLHSLVYFTNWALSRCTRRYACKWDADMVLTRERRGAFAGMLSRLGRGWPAAWSFVGQTVYRTPDGSFLAPRGEVNREVRLAPCDYRVRFHKREHWEQLIRPRWLRTHHFAPVCFYELKFLDEEEFDHWSTMDFPSARKRREWATFQRLRGGGAGGADMRAVRRLPATFLDEQVGLARPPGSGGGRPDRSPRGERPADERPARKRALKRWMPGFLGIGATRAGTSWVAAQLSRHPQIRMDRKEIHFFDRKLGALAPSGSARDRFNQIRYLARFVRARRGGGRGTRRGGRIRGEITPAYAILEPAVIRRVAEWMPDSRLIFMMRDPIDRAWSQARNGFPRWRGKPLESVSRDELVSFFNSDPVRRRSDYATCLRAWFEHFPREQFFFGFLDEIRERPEDVMRDLLGFLEAKVVVADAESLEKPVNASAPVPMPGWVREHLEREYAFDADEVSELVGRQVPWSR
ncbi:sulfotransferase domain-containing protein [Candidatus Palauibacter polyketidifaciens]|uniref:sulfotransferase domain-containing protein n=2 Tax=Candidatus Palauibacter polyketidifaciens TaxID=3056740 RepID=UPI0028774831|nr:sulfotransferase domain-containing protein [Candidatus Palauibacter polyketidifaciens]